MVKAIPQLVDELIGEQDAGPRLGRKAGDKANDPLHQHGVVVHWLHALELALDQVDEGSDFCVGGQ